MSKMNSTDRDGDTRRALIQTSILPESLSNVSPQQHTQTKGPRHMETELDARQVNQYLSREQSSEDVLYSGRKPPSATKDIKSARKQHDSLGPLQLSIELEQLDIKDAESDGNDRQKSQIYYKEEITGVMSPEEESMEVNMRP